ncbi:MAG TPA: ribosome maturation factor RimM [Thermomicrobiaceae bacterium]|nr:ribosome maturation factor RimM [Thermomicrobiaceae bacterium]
MSESPREPAPDPARLSIGVIAGPQGVQGAVRMSVWTQFPERIPTFRRVYLDDEPEPRRVRSARVQRGIAVLMLEGVETRDAADALRGTVVRIDRSQAAPLGEDEYYHFQLIGLDVVDEAGNRLGTLKEILETGANDVYVVRADDGTELLFPALKNVVLSVDLGERRIVVRPLVYED